MSSTCSNGLIISDFNYETLRNNNMKQISQYYNKALNKYTQYYRNYLAKKDEDQDYAEYLENEDPKLRDLNSNLIGIKRELNDYINKDFEHIQKQTVTLKKTEIQLEKGKEEIKKLNKILTLKANENKTNEDSLDETSKLNTVNNYWHYGYIIANVLLLASIISFFFQTSSTKNTFFNLTSTNNANRRNNKNMNYNRNRNRNSNRNSNNLRLNNRR